MIDSEQNILFLCTGNSARSILAEALLTRLSQGLLIGYSAGSDPVGTVNSQALALLEERRYDTTALRSKSWDEFTRTGAPHIHMVVTVCDNAASETCPIWPGTPTRLHWSLPDPAAVSGTRADIQSAFIQTYDTLHRRIQKLIDSHITDRPQGSPVRIVS